MESFSHQEDIETTAAKAKRSNNDSPENSLEYFLPQIQTKANATTKETPHNPRENTQEHCARPNEDHLTVISKVTTEVMNVLRGEARKIFREESESVLKEISRKPQCAKKRSKKSNLRVIYIRKEIWPLVEKFRKTPNEPIGDTLSRMAKAAMRYLEHGGSLEALEGQTSNLQNSNNQD